MYLTWKVGLSAIISANATAPSQVRWVDCMPSLSRVRFCCKASLDACSTCKKVDVYKRQRHVRAMYLNTEIVIDWFLSLPGVDLIMRFIHTVFTRVAKMSYVNSVLYGSHMTRLTPKDFELVNNLCDSEKISSTRYRNS